MSVPPLRDLDANPYGQVRVVDPDTMAEYALDLRFAHTETEGPAFDAMAANLKTRLLVLRKRLAGGRHGIEIERVGRGRFVMRLADPLELAMVETTGPMRAAHAAPASE